MKKLLKRLMKYPELDIPEPYVHPIFIPYANSGSKAAESNMTQIGLADHRLQKQALQKNLTLVFMSLVVSAFSVVIALASVAVAIFALLSK